MNPVEGCHLYQSYLEMKNQIIHTLWMSLDLFYKTQLYQLSKLVLQLQLYQTSKLVSQVIKGTVR